MGLCGWLAKLPGVFGAVDTPFQEGEYLVASRIEKFHTLRPCHNNGILDAFAISYAVSVIVWWFWLGSHHGLMWLISSTEVIRG